MAQTKIKNSIVEGLSPIYKNGRITPGTRGLGPKYEKDMKLKMMPRMKANPLPSKKEKPKIRNIKNLA